MTHVNYRLDAKLSRQAPEQLVDLDDVELVIVEPDEQDVFIIDPVTGAREAVQKKPGNSPKSVKQNVTQLSGENTPSIDTQATDKPAISLERAEASPSVDPHTYTFLGNIGSQNPPSRTKGRPLTTVQMSAIIDAVCTVNRDAIRFRGMLTINPGLGSDQANRKEIQRKLKNFQTKLKRHGADGSLLTIYEKEEGGQLHAHSLVLMRRNFEYLIEEFSSDDFTLDGSLFVDQDAVRTALYLIKQRQPLNGKFGTAVRKSIAKLMMKRLGSNAYRRLLGSMAGDGIPTNYLTALRFQKTEGFKGKRITHTGYAKKLFNRCLGQHMLRQNRNVDFHNRNLKPDEKPQRKKHSKQSIDRRLSGPSVRPGRQPPSEPVPF